MFHIDFVGGGVPARWLDDYKRSLMRRTVHECTRVSKASDGTEVINHSLWDSRDISPCDEARSNLR